MDRLAQPSYDPRRPLCRTLQRFQGRDRQVLRLRLRSHQCLHVGTYRPIRLSSFLFRRKPFFLLIDSNPHQVYGYAIYQHRITMIRRRDPGHFGMSTTRTEVLLLRSDQFVVL